MVSGCFQLDGVMVYGCFEELSAFMMSHITWFKLGGYGHHTSYDQSSC